MNETRDDDVQELENIDDRIEELFDEMSPSAIAEEAKEDGENTAEGATQVRAIFATVYKNYTQRHLRAAQAIYEQASQMLSTEKFDDLPDTLEDQVALLAAVQAAQPHLLEPFTLKYRNFETMSVSGRRSLLRQLKHLGILDLILHNDQERQ
jgi:hypothetical protein